MSSHFSHFDHSQLSKKWTLSCWNDSTNDCALFYCFNGSALKAVVQLQPFWKRFPYGRYSSTNSLKVTLFELQSSGYSSLPIGCLFSMKQGSGHSIIINCSLTCGLGDVPFKYILSKQWNCPLQKLANSYLKVWVCKFGLSSLIRVDSYNL